jgi:hypothetical protein
MRRPLLPLLLGVLFAAAACNSSTPSGPTAASTGAVATGTAAGFPAPTVSASPAPASLAPTPSASPAPDDTVWLCKPGLAADPCNGSLDATAFDAAGKATLQPASRASDPPIDCFYVYPTVSKQKTVNATLAIDPEERAVAAAQAARFSQVCRVFAPMYPQLTLAAIANPSKITLTEAVVAYGAVDSAFRNYMAHYNDGRGIVFIGHSQGAIMLTALLRYEVDASPETRRLMVSAILAGANVTVPVGKSVGGSFANIPACASRAETGCVVAYSSFDRTPPADAVFGRTGSALSLFGASSTVPEQILCVNPAAPGGGTATLAPYFPTGGLVTLLGKAAPSFGASTPWVTFPNEYSAHCEDTGGASWLQVDHIGSQADARPRVSQSTPAWGLHTVDVNIALGNLVELVRSEAAAYH